MKTFRFVVLARWISEKGPFLTLQKVYEMVATNEHHVWAAGATVAMSDSQFPVRPTDAVTISCEEVK